MIDLTRASITRTSEGVTIDDPASPWTAHVTVAENPTRTTTLTLKARPGAPGITAARLARLPLAQIQHVAAAETLGADHPDDAWWRLLAQPKPAGARSWPAAHWTRVAAIGDWAAAAGLPGGAGAAVARAWGISLHTAYRWLATARRRRT